MSRLVRICAIGLLLSAVSITVWLLVRPNEPVAAVATVQGLTPNTSIEGYSRALQPRDFVFPRDHGPHTDYQTEWWYYTGNLSDANGRHFDYQLTFFRRALVPDQQMPKRTSDLAASQIYFAHFAVTDSQADKHTSAERFSRGAGGLAGASGEPFNVFLESWSAVALDEKGDRVRLIARDGTTQIALDLRSVKPIVEHGNAGLSAKSDAAGNASYYYSFTRLETIGTVTTGSGEHQVTGTSWMDHEWGTSALGPNAEGWDWFALQLDNQRELMLFQVRNNDGTVDPVSGGTLINADGSSTVLKREQIQIDVLERWRSPVNKVEYPVRWKINIADHKLALEIRARINDQQMLTSVVYWEGAVVVSGSSDGSSISGVGYVELTGYSGTLNGKF
jgi:predicted secreted hydrolase